MHKYSHPHLVKRGELFGMCLSLYPSLKNEPFWADNNVEKKVNHLYFDAISVDASHDGLVVQKQMVRRVLTTSTCHSNEKTVPVPMLNY